VTIPDVVRRSPRKMRAFGAGRSSTALFARFEVRAPGSLHFGGVHTRIRDGKPIILIRYRTGTKRHKISDRARRFVHNEKSAHWASTTQLDDCRRDESASMKWSGF
jgi:hypothetical protein